MIPITDIKTLSDLRGLRVVSGRGQYVAKAESIYYENVRVELLMIDGSIVEFREDANDGYRSCLGDLKIVDRDSLPAGSFVEFPPVVCNVRMRVSNEFGRQDDVAVFICESTGLVLGEYGTVRLDDYYPSFVAGWSPTGGKLSEGWEFE